MSSSSGGSAAEVLAGRYRLDERIGVGAMGEVWRARDLTLERDVALKRVRLDGLVEEQAQARFRREAVVMAGLTHPNVVSVYDAGTDSTGGSEIAYLVMELLDGPSCSELIRSKRTMSIEEIRQIASGVAAGLAAAHAAGVVHRDIKPGNVVVSRGVPKIVDFGIARLEQESTATLTAPQTTLGTAAYMSPEQALGEAAGPPSDVYSLGALIVALATGTPPFGASNALALMRAHIDEPAPELIDLREDVPAELSGLVSRMLAKEPSERPSALEVAEVLGGLDDGGVMAPTRPLPAIAPVGASDDAADPVAAAPVGTGAGGDGGAATDDAGAQTASARSGSASPEEEDAGPTGVGRAGAAQSGSTVAGPGSNLASPGDGFGATATDPGPQGPTQQPRGGGWLRRMWWGLAAALLVVAGVIGLNLLLDQREGATASPGVTPTVTPTERIITREPPAIPAVTTAPDPSATTLSPSAPTAADRDAAIRSVVSAIAAVRDTDAREDLESAWQDAEAALQGPRAVEELNLVLAEAEELAAEGDITSNELSSIRSAVEALIAIL